MDGFNYENKEVKVQQGGKIVRHVKIKNGKGYKSVTKYRGGRKVGTKRRPICGQHIHMIRSGIFIPGLFSDCKCGEKGTRKRRGVSK